MLLTRFYAMRRGFITLGGRMRTVTEMIMRWLAHARLGPMPTGEIGRRQRRRWSWQQALRIRIGDTELEGLSFNVSAHGVGVLLSTALPVGTRVEISDGIDTCWAPAQVVYVEPGEGQSIFRTGLRFDTPPGELGVDRGV